MKKTLTINISGVVFHIDEDAFDKLQIYLKSLNGKFGATDEGREIITDIEARIAEIFTEKSKDQKNVITTEDVDHIIEIMGTPEEFDASEDDETTTEDTRYEYRKHRRLYRDPDNTIISGVCGGLAAYFNIDPVAVRIIFVILFFFPTGLSLLTYIILWLAVPVARTTAQKLEMRGEKVTVSNIERTIKDEFKNVKENYQEFKKSKSYQNTKDGIARFFEIIGITLKALFKLILIILGIVFVFTGAIILISLVSALFVGGIANIHFLGFDYIPLPPILNAFTDPSMVWMFVMGLFLVTFIPILALVYGSVKLIFKFKSNDRLIGLTALGLWLIALGTLIVISFNEAGNFRTSARSTESYRIDNPANNILYLKAAPDKYDDYSYYDEYIDLDDMILVEVDNKIQLFGKPELDIIKTTGEEIELVFKKRSRGKSKSDARENADEIVYKWIQNDSLIVFDQYFKLPEDVKWRHQEFDMILKLPVGKTVYLDRSMIDIIYDIDNVTNTYDRKMVGKYWSMKPDGLTKVYIE